MPFWRTTFGDTPLDLNDFIASDDSANDVTNTTGNLPEICKFDFSKWNMPKSRECIKRMSLKRHTINKCNKDHKCESCGKSFADEGNLKKHINIIHEGKSAKTLEIITTFTASSREKQPTFQIRTNHEDTSAFQTLKKKKRKLQQIQTDDSLAKLAKNSVIEISIDDSDLDALNMKKTELMEMVPMTFEQGFHEGWNWKNDGGNNTTKNGGLRIHKYWKHDPYCLCSDCVFMENNDNSMQTLTKSIEIDISDDHEEFKNGHTASYSNPLDVIKDLIAEESKNDSNDKTLEIKTLPASSIDKEYPKNDEIPKSNLKPNTNQMHQTNQRNSDFRTSQQIIHTNSLAKLAKNSGDTDINALKMTFEQQVTDSIQHHEEGRAISTNGTNGGGEMMEGLRIHKNWKHDSYCLCSECVF